MPRQLPDTPWHIGYSKMKESDQRRLNKRCVHYDASICRAPKSGCYLLRCGGSSHCRFYAEDENASMKIKRDNQTQMDIDAEKRRRYVEMLKPQMHALVSSSDDRRYMSVQSLTRCFVCGRKLLKLAEDRKQCQLCHMEYVDQISWLTDGKSMAGRFVYVMGRKKPKNVLDSHKKELCRFDNGNGRCWDKNSPLFQKQCDLEYCKKLKKQGLNTEQTKKLKFSGVKYIPIEGILIPKMTHPRQSKIDTAAAAIRQNGGLVTPIYVGLSGNQYILKEGYVRYLAARQCGMSSVPATFEWERINKK